MGNDTLKAALIKMRESLNSNELDPETLALAQQLEADIQQALDANSDTPQITSSVDLALALETRFESEHPLAASCVREIVNALHRMGI